MARTIKLDTVTHPSNSGTANQTLDSSGKHRFQRLILMVELLITAQLAGQQQEPEHLTVTSLLFSQLQASL